MAAPKKNSPTTGGGTAVAEKPTTTKTTLEPPVSKEQLAQAEKMVTEPAKQPGNGTLPLSGITLGDVQSRMIATETRIAEWRSQIADAESELGFYQKVVSTFGLSG